MNLIMLGPPGAGKGTQAQKLVERFKVPQVSTGDLLRAAVREGTRLGKEAKGYMDKGQLVPDAVVIGMVKERLAVKDCRGGFILDGFPRAVTQAEALEGLLKELHKSMDAVVSIEVPEEELVRRLTGRLSCPKCGAMFHASSKPPRAVGICDACGAGLITRVDDNEATIRNRIKVYREQTEPLKAFYQARGLLRAVDGTGSPESIGSKIGEALSGKKR
jgi:adenylate kinase